MNGTGDAPEYRNVGKAFRAETGLDRAHPVQVRASRQEVGVLCNDFRSDFA